MHDMMKKSKWGVLLVGILAALLFAGTGTAYAATVAIDLYAKAVPAAAPTFGLAGVAQPFLGYSLTDTAPPLPGGPTLIVNQGDVVQVTLHNGLTEATSVLFQGQAILPDATGVAAGADNAAAPYTFTAASPGTFLYEAGLLPNSQHQAAMGLYGALVVRPATAGQAYDDAATAYTDEAVLVLSEFDPALAANPAGFDMRNYAPKYFLINGKAYPATDPIPSVAGNKILLRYVNAGIQHHSIAVLGLRQNFVAKDASLLPTLNHNVAAETLAPGQTGDAIATVPATTTTGSRFAVYDGSLMLHNSNTAGLGGMLTFVTVGTGSGATGPVTSNVALSPNPSNGSTDVTLTAAITSDATAAEYFVDGVGANGTGCAIAGSPTSVNVAIPVSGGTAPCVDLTTLASGKHTFYVHGTDGTNWGAVASAVLNLDKTGPATTGLTLTPNPSSGTVAVALHGTGNDSATGGSNIVAAEYFIGPVPVNPNGLGTGMVVNVAAPVASIDATIAPPVSGDIVSVHSMDALGNWGGFATITLNVVAAGPVTSNVSAAKNPNNGALPLNSSQPVVRVTATMTSTGSTVGGAEGFIDTPPASVSVRGFPFVPSDGVWNGATEVGYADVPLTTINALSVGNHTIYVRGRDAVGNWGATAATVLVIDKTVPTIASVALTPSTMVFGTASTLLTVSASDVGTGVSGGQYWIDGTSTPPANATGFTGTSATIATATLAGGNHTVYVRVQDAATNWSTVSSAQLIVIRAVDDTRTISANTNATQNSDANAAAGVLANDQPLGAAGRTAAIASAPVRTSGTGAGTIAVTCPATLGTAATPAIGGNTVCTNGAYRVILNGIGSSGNARRASKRGTFQFTYTETLNAVTTPPATVTITVN